jgi:hypothetical protein
VNDLPRVLSFVEAGRYLGGDTSPETIRTWAKRGLLRRVRIGRRTFVLREDLDKLIDAQLDARRAS